MWMTGLNWLVMDTQRAPAPQQIDRCDETLHLASNKCYHQISVFEAKLYLALYRNGFYKHWEKWMKCSYFMTD